MACRTYRRRKVKEEQEDFAREQELEEEAWDDD